MAACLAVGCATGANVGNVDAGGSPDPTDATSAHDVVTGGDGGTPFVDAGFPAVDAAKETGPGPGDGATADGGLTDASDGGDDAGLDGGNPAMDSSTCPAGMTGPGCTACASGFHLCGATCTADETNDPSVGCSQSCGGGACAAMGEEVASCSTAGQCTYACPTGTLSCGSGVCAACCTDGDCSGSTPDCVSGTCQAAGCAPPSAECSGVCTDLSTNANCGSCGTDCPTSAECIASTLLGFPVGCACADSGGGDYECE
jgi:hypothetical protein